MHISRYGVQEVIRKTFASEAWCEFVLEISTYMMFRFYSSANTAWILTLAVLWLWGLPAELSRQRPGFDPSTIRLGFVVDKVKAGHVFEYLDLCLYHPPTIRNHPLMCHRRCVISDIDSDFKQHTYSKHSIEKYEMVGTCSTHLGNKK